MQLTTQSTETFVRKFAAASLPELHQCAKELKSIAADLEQTAKVRLVAKDMAAIIRKQIRRF